MALLEPFDDEVLGPVIWDSGKGEWRFSITLSNGRTVHGGIVPYDDRVPLQDQGLNEIRDSVRWVRDNEPAIRASITERMFEGWKATWYDEEVDEITTPAEFREAISLRGISVLEDRKPTLYYDDANLFGGHAIVLSLNAQREIEHGPNIWG
jgi:hypothetical protein